MARLISMAEDRSSGIETSMKELYPFTGHAWTIGITGSPGAGKSTLTDKLIEHFRSQGLKVGVLAIDPSSPYTGGAILADRLRMQRHTDDEGVFLRSLGARGSLGGLSRGTREGIAILDACGFDIVIVETVGVGQSEIDIMRVADTVCVVLVPGLGDDIQAMKAGIMEIADLFVINKADKPGADKVVSEVRAVLDFLKEKAWIPPVCQTVAENGQGVAELGKALQQHRDYLLSGEEAKRRERSRLTLKIESILTERISDQVSLLWKEKREDFIEALLRRELDPYTVADTILRGSTK